MTRRNTPAVLSLALALGLGACAAPGAGTVPMAAPSTAPASPLAAAVATITPADMYARIEFLAGDAMRGRDTPSPELEITANYLVQQYKLLGLEPAGENGTFVQRWPFPLRQGDAAGTRMVIAGPGGTQTLQLGRDFFATGGTAAELDAGLVFVGRVTDSIMGPGTLRERIAVTALPGTNTRDFRLERNRQANAAQRAGASAIVYVLDPSWTADSIARYAREAGQPARTLGGATAFPRFFVSQAAARRVFTAAGLSLDELWAQDAAARPVPLPGVSARAGAPQQDMDRATAPNVVAVLRGSDRVLRDEYIIVSAHMDHVGVGTPVNGDSIYNGADDDASGTAALLEIAEAMASLPEPPRRSVVFLHVSGEEKGLLGSRWYSDNPTLPLERIVANINIDMIARNAPDTVVVIGKDYSTMGQTVNAVGARHPELGLVVSDDIWPEERFFFRSDHFNFARKEIPALFFFTGVHEDYHRPSDTVERIDAGKAARVTRLVFYTLHDLANADARPRWDPAGLEEVRALTR
ncbi:MAG: M20/M25/M40 family metallo-hydrolase [Gemmatimonadota bacterium]|nr:M20/M25/M40 family metallo-hydrolase [Gemmatimonadota bacterium]